MKQYDQLLLDKIKEEKLNRKRIEEKGDRANAPRFDHLAAALDEYYFVNQLQVYCAYLSYSKIVRPEMIPYNRAAFKMIGPIITVIESGTITNPFIQIFNQIRILFEEITNPGSDAQKRFDKILKLIRRNQKEETIEICLEALSFLSNYCTRMINQKQSDYIEKFFIINNEIINGLYGDHPGQRKTLPASIYKNMVVTALKIEDNSFFATIQTTGLTPKNQDKGFADAVEWAIAFTQRFGKKLTKDSKAKYHSYCQAYIKFQQGNFLAAYHLLNNPIRLRGMFINMNIRKLHLQILFELQLSDPDILDKDDVDIKAYCESLRKLIGDDLNRKKQMSYQASYFIEFEKLYRQMVRLYFKYKLPYMSKDANYTKEMSHFLKAIEACDYSFKEWFLDKYTQMK